MSQFPSLIFIWLFNPKPSSLSEHFFLFKVPPFKFIFICHHFRDYCISSLYHQVPDNKATRSAEGEPFRCSVGSMGDSLRLQLLSVQANLEKSWSGCTVTKFQTRIASSSSRTSIKQGNCAYAGFAYLYNFLGPEDHHNLHVETVSVRTYLWNCRNLVVGDGEAGIQSRKNHVVMDAVWPDPTMNAASFLSDLLPTESENTV